MQVKENIRRKIAVTRFAELNGGDVFAYGGMVMMKCINDGEDQFRNTVNLESGNMYALHDGAEVIPINAILQEEAKRIVELVDSLDILTTMP